MTRRLRPLMPVPIALCCAMMVIPGLSRPCEQHACTPDTKWPVANSCACCSLCGPSESAQTCAPPDRSSETTAPGRCDCPPACPLPCCQKPVALPAGVIFPDSGVAPCELVAEAPAQPTPTTDPHDVFHPPR